MSNKCSDLTQQNCQKIKLSGDKSCNNYYNSQRIKKITMLQEKISSDYNNLELLTIYQMK